VDHGAPEPAYQQLAVILRTRIAKGERRNGPLPSVKQLQQEHDVGRDTVLRAVEILRTEGLVLTVPGAAPTSAQTPRSGPQSHILHSGTRYLYRQPQPSALTTPIGHDTPVPWSGQYPYGFLASDRYCWW